MDIKQLTRSLTFAGKAVKMAERLLVMAGKAGIEAPKRRKRRAKAENGAEAPKRTRKSKRRATGPGVAKEEE